MCHLSFHRGLLDVLFVMCQLSLIEAFSMCLFVCHLSTIETFSMCCFVCLLFVHQGIFNVPFVYHRGLIDVLFRTLLPRSFYLYPLSTARIFSGVPFAHRYSVLVHLFK